MEAGNFQKDRGIYLVKQVVFLCILLVTRLAVAQGAEQPSPVELISPSANSEVIGRRPEISCQINIPFISGHLYVYLDGVDVSGIADVSENGFLLKPVAALGSGSHTLLVMFYGQDGRQINQEFTFSSRHSKTFDELSSTNEITARYQTVLDKPSDATHIPYSAINANLATSSKVKKGAWQFSLDGNIRYLDQNMAVEQPLYKGANVINYTAKLERNSQVKGGYHLLAEVGDVQINESATTIQNMARRGGKVTVDYRDMTVSGFVINSTPVYGFRNAEDGLGIDSSDDDHLMGISGQVGFMGNKVLLKSLYITGGETGGGFGLYTELGGSKGHVTSAVLQTDLFNQKMVTMGEFSISNFDPDIADTWDSEDDRAYRLGLSGATTQYFYQAVYEYFGPYYSVPGQFIISDREGFFISGGKNFSSQKVSLQFSRHNDNVENDDFYPRVTTTQTTVAYNFSKFQSIPMALSYAKTMMESNSEPEGSTPYHMDTDLISGTVSYYKGTFSLALQPSYSLQNDRLSDNDTSNTTMALSGNYAMKSFAVASLISFNRAHYDISGEVADTYLANLHLQGRALNDILSYGISGSYNLSEADTGGRSDTLAADAEIAYFLKDWQITNLFNPSIGLRSTYTKTNVDSLDDENEELVFYLVLTSRIPFSL